MKMELVKSQLEADGISVGLITSKTGYGGERLWFCAKLLETVWSALQGIRWPCGMLSVCLMMEATLEESVYLVLVLICVDIPVFSGYNRPVTLVTNPEIEKEKL